MGSEGNPSDDDEAVSFEPVQKGEFVAAVLTPEYAKLVDSPYGIGKVLAVRRDKVTVRWYQRLQGA